MFHSGLFLFYNVSQKMSEKKEPLITSEGLMVLNSRKPKELAKTFKKIRKSNKFIGKVLKRLDKDGICRIEFDNSDEAVDALRFLTNPDNNLPYNNLICIRLYVPASCEQIGKFVTGNSAGEYVFICSAHSTHKKTGKKHYNNGKF